MNERKRLLILGVVVIIAAIGFYAYSTRNNTQETVTNTHPDYKNITYVINGKEVALNDGYAEAEAAPGSASKIVTKYFGNEVHKDLNGYGKEDVAFLLTQETGGSGTFYYVVAAIDTDNGYVGSHGYYIGDRIAPQTTESGSGDAIIVNYADRLPDESFSTKPSVGKSLYLQLNTSTMELQEVQ